MDSLGYSVGAASGPPPPPPPPVPGQVPALRINTASEAGSRKQQPSSQDRSSHEPPPAIQNAMMTKDKKPFTYTPGMGGKLDLSQIRSPRMARRVAKNANDEGIEGPPKSAISQQPTQHQPSGIYAQPQVAVPVLPQGMPQQPAVNLRNSTLPRSLPGGGIIIPVIERQTEPVPRPVVKVETKIQPVANSPDTPTPPMSPTQVTLSKAPTPWMQKQVKQQEELPEWAKRTSANRPQDAPSSDPSSPLQHEFPAAPRQIVIVNTPKQQTQSLPYQQQQQQYQQQQQTRPTHQENERIVPLRIEDRPSIFSAMNESGHHQLMNSAPHHQSRWGNPVGQSGYQQPQPGTHIIPIQLDDQQQYQVPNSVSSPVAIINNQTQYRPVDNQSNRNAQRGHVPMCNQQVEPSPVQSKSFRVLQKITDTDPDQIDEEHLRKLQLTDDDRYLMNKFKEQVDGDTYLHKEEDPRYRGAAIPSRAFRYLQNMTDSGDAINTNTTAAKTVNPAIKKQNRSSKTFDEVSVPVTAYVPASEQQVQEPKKYMGGAIPSRSFKILQAMTAPESIDSQVTQENREHSATDFINMMGNQQGSQWKHNLSTTPTSCTTSTTETSDKYTEEQPLSSLSSEGDSENEQEDEDDCYLKRSDDEEKNSSAESSDCSSDSDSYVAYSTGLNPLNQKLNLSSEKGVKDESEEKYNEDRDSTDGEKETLFEDVPTFEEEEGGEEAEEDDEEDDDEEDDDEEDDDEEDDDEEVVEEEEEEEEDKDNGKDKTTNQLIDEESINDTIVSISLPLKLKFSLSEKNEDVTAVIVGDSNIVKNVETCVDFTLKKIHHPIKDKVQATEETAPIKPTFIVTTTDDDPSNENNSTNTTMSSNTNTKDQGKTMLSVQNYSKEDVTDDDDSGVTSDVSRRISEADTDSECCLTTGKTTAMVSPDNSPSPKRSSNKKYYRTQTHSRLFKLLSDEQLLGSSLSNYEENSSNSSGLTSPDCSHVDETILITARQRLLARPKSLDCEALFRRQKDCEQDSYYQTWKNGERSPRKSSTVGVAQWTYPRANVLCPRIKSAKNVSQALKKRQQLSRQKSPLGSTMISSSFPSSVGTSKRC